MFGLCPRACTDRDNAVPSALALCRRELYAHCMTVNYRESYGLHATSGILFNHESPLRGIEFVTRKVTDAVGPHQAWPDPQTGARQHRSPARWGHAPGLCRGNVVMLQQDQPDEYVVATGRTTTVRDCAGSHSNMWD